MGKEEHTKRNRRTKDERGGKGRKGIEKEQEQDG